VVGPATRFLPAARTVRFYRRCDLTLDNLAADLAQRALGGDRSHTPAFETNTGTTSMQNFLKKTATLIAATMLISFGITADAAEKKQQSYVKNNYRTAYKTAVAIGDVPNHEIAQEVSIADIKYSNPDFKTRDEWALVHTDSVDGSGTQTGYYVDTHHDGSQTYGAFKGMIKTSNNPDGSWEVMWEGTYWYVGGSGRYKNIKGQGKYKGGVSSKNPAAWEEGQETIEY